jgi:hypothetical protein
VCKRRRTIADDVEHSMLVFISQAHCIAKCILLRTVFPGIVSKFACLATCCVPSLDVHVGCCCVLSHCCRWDYWYVKNR